MAGYTVFVLEGATYYTENSVDVKVYGNDKGPFYRQPKGVDKIVEVQIYADDGDGTITFRDKEDNANNEIDTKISAAVLYVANRATNAKFDVRTHKYVLGLSVPIDGGEVGWNFNPGGIATASLQLKVRVKNLSP